MKRGMVALLVIGLALILGACNEEYTAHRIPLLEECGGSGNPYAVNDYGKVLLRCWKSGAWIWDWSSDSVIYIGPGGDEGISSVSDLNNSDQVVGRADHGFHNFAMIWEDGVRTDLGDFEGGTPDSKAIAVNKHGHVVGAGHKIPEGETESRQRAALWRKGEIIDLGTLEGYIHSVALDLNDKDHVIGTLIEGNGSGVSTAFLWKKGSMQLLADIVGANDPTRLDARGINNKGQICGKYIGNPFVWNGDELLIIPDLDPEHRGGRFWEINDYGHAVGRTLYGDRLAVGWTETTGLIDLNTLVPEDFEWTLTLARDVSDTGFIICDALHKVTGEVGLFLLVPNFDYKKVGKNL